MPAPSRREVGLIALASGVAAVVLAAGIGAPSLWWDEIATLSAATRPLPDLIALVAHVDLVHLAYYLVMHGWLLVAPHDEFWLRLPSALCAAATVPALYGVGRMLSTRPVAIVAVILLVALPRTGWTATEARSFALTTLLTTVLVLVFLAAARSGRGVTTLAVGVLGELTVVVWIYAAAVLVALLVATPLLVSDARRRVALAGAAAIPIVAALPFVLAVVAQRSQVGGTRPTGPELPKFVLAEQWFPDATPVAVCFWLAALAFAVIAILRRRTAGRASLRRGALVLLGVWLLLPLMAVVGASTVLERSLYQPRAFAFTSPALALLVAIAAVRAVGWRVAAVLAVVLAVAAVPSYAGDRVATAKGTDWRAAAELAASGASGRTAVVFVDRTDAGFVDEVPSAMTLAYPADFASLDDVTLQATPVEAADLFGVRAAPDRWPASLEGYDRLVVVRGTADAAPETAEARAVLDGIGFARVGVETVAGTAVEVWTR